MTTIERKNSSFGIEFWLGLLVLVLGVAAVLWLRWRPPYQGTSYLPEGAAKMDSRLWGHAANAVTDETDNTEATFGGRKVEKTGTTQYTVSGWVRYENWLGYETTQNFSCVVDISKRPPSTVVVWEP